MATITGTGVGEIIPGTNLDDTINARGGNDTVNGDAGNDTVNGQSGNDELHGDAGNDIITGGAGEDYLDGGADNDTLNGGADNDTLVGGGGNDVMNGGAGADTFLITGGGADAITGFKLGEDILDFAEATGQGDITFTRVSNNQVIASGPGIPGGSLVINGANVGKLGPGNGFEQLQNEALYCFYPGTMIATPDGEKAVETLQVGDLVLTADGRSEPVRWLGKQTVSPIFSDKLKTLPIRIKAGALGENVPSRDLLVSPGHAMFIDGVLVVAGALVNGTSIVRQTKVPAAFVYYHVELNEHALILAENAPAESFVDNVDRENFDNWAEHERLYAHLPPMVEMDYPVAKSHRQVPSAIRQMLAKRAALIADAGQNVA